jgi:hypothetical protein
MNKKPARHIVVKTLMNADEFLEFDQACKEADKTHSAKLREMAKNFATGRNDRRRRSRSEWPAQVHNQAMFFPSRVNYGAMPHMRMRT